MRGEGKVRCTAGKQRGMADWAGKKRGMINVRITRPANTKQKNSLETLYYICKKDKVYNVMYIYISK